MTNTELLLKIQQLVISYVGGVEEDEFKELLTDMVNTIDLSVVEEIKTASFTILDSDTFKLYVINSASDIIVTLPSGLTEGYWWEFIRLGIGSVTFVNGVGASVISPDDRLLIRAKYSYARAIARASDEISLSGDLVL